MENWTIINGKKVAVIKFWNDDLIKDVYCPVNGCEKGEFYRFCKSWFFTCPDHSCRGMDEDSNECYNFSQNGSLSHPRCHACISNGF